MAEQGSGEPSSGSSECNSKYTLNKKADESNSRLTEFTQWLTALKENLTVTQTTHLELNSIRIGATEAAAIYKLLPNSHVVDVSISCNGNLNGDLENLLQLLVTSQIKKLSFCCCMFIKEEFLQLMGVLKNTHITELIVNYENCNQYSSLDGGKFDSDEVTEFTSYFLESRLTRLDCPEPFVLTPLLRVVQNTSVTYLDVSETNIPTDVLRSLFSTLPCTQITDLILSKSRISEDLLQELSLNLKDSNVVNLNLAYNNMSDAGLDVLAEGLAHSKIRSLDISGNRITGSNSFGLCLKDSQISSLKMSQNEITSQELLSFAHSLIHSSIVKLDLWDCSLSDELGQQLIKCLRFSKVTHLNLAYNQLGLLSIAALAAILKDTALKSVDFSHNCLLPEAVILLGDCLKGSKIKSIRLNNHYESQDPAFPPAFVTFFEKTKDTSLEIVNLSFTHLDSKGWKFIAASLVNTTFTDLDLHYAAIGDSIFSLAPQLKFTAITRLNLDGNKLYAAGAVTLARCIAETQIIELLLNSNFIGDEGAKALATSLKGSKLIHLELSSNGIGNEGLEALALHAQGTFLNILNVQYNPGNREFLIGRILLDNQTAVHRFVSFFKQIAPKSNDNSFRFSNIMDDRDVGVLLEECLLFYKTVLEQSSAASVLVVEGSLSYLMEKSIKLLKKEFPRQFTAFVANQIEASPAQHVGFLRRAEELELTKIVELHLLHRSTLMIDQDVGIMHPYVYQLLHKYKQPLYNTSIEPEGKTKIIEYFTEHSNLDGAIDVLNILISEQKLGT